MKNVGVSPATLAALASRDVENFLVAATPGGIECQEAMGQAALVGSNSSLPRDGDRKVLEAWGVKFQDDIDDLFVRVTLPAGWKLEASDHSMWSYLLDDKGRKRAGVFYKAAFYDRKAHLRVNTYLSVERVYCNSEGVEDPPDKNSTHIQDLVKDADGRVLFSAPIVEDRDYKAGDATNQGCRAWLAEHFSKWQDATAYWD